MMSAAKERDYPSTWPAWVITIDKELEAAEETGGIEIEVPGQPKWVLLIRIELGKLFVPTVRKTDYLDNGPRFIGKVLGHQRKLLKGENGLARQLDRGADAVDRLLEEIQRRLNKKAYARFLKKAEKWQAKFEPDSLRMIERLETMVKQKVRVINRGLKLSIEQSEVEHKDFQRGYFEALDRELYDDQGHLLHEKLSSTTMIYHLMATYWRWVRQLPSIPALHRWLCAVLGASQVGDVSRVKGICRRFGVHLAPRGRPRKKR
jgi:hypothetical protein